ncbi:MAG: hypothetical protein IT371_20040 [Deltaproteobacteria bacterium]|nr:hypothetical protein [Deltaproteobacteria bacterium]
MSRADTGPKADAGPKGDTLAPADAGDPCAKAGCSTNATCAIPDGGAAKCTCKPGYEGDGKTCTDVAATLSGLRWDLPCTSGTSDGTACTTSPKVTHSATLGGASSKTYLVELRFRGVVEQKTYNGGTNDGALWQVGGTPAGDTYNIYALALSDPKETYYLNRGASLITRCFSLDYTKTIEVKGGAKVELVAESLDNREIINKDDKGQPIVVPGVPPDPKPYDGQFVQMDVVSVKAKP